MTRLPCTWLLNVNGSASWQLLQPGCITRQGRWVLTDVDTYIWARTSCALSLVELAASAAGRDCHLIVSLFAQYDTRRWIEYILQRPEMNCTDIVQDAVAVVDLAGDEGMYHGLSSCFRQWPPYNLQLSQVVGTLARQTAMYCPAVLRHMWLQWTPRLQHLQI